MITFQLNMYYLLLLKKKAIIIFGDYQTLGSSASAKRLDDADTPEDENTPAEEPPQA